jgi:membrane-associated protease RseP (regulator of RpoE activity)
MAKKPIITDETPEVPVGVTVTPVDTSVNETLETPHTVQEGESIQADGVEGDLPVGTVIESAPEANASSTESEEIPKKDDESEETTEEINESEVLSNVKNAITATLGSRVRMTSDEKSIVVAVDPQEISTLNKIVEVVGKGVVTGVLDIAKMTYSINLKG